MKIIKVVVVTWTAHNFLDWNTPCDVHKGIKVFALTNDADARIDAYIKRKEKALKKKYSHVVVEDTVRVLN